jgi:hypothetical protein
MLPAQASPLWQVPAPNPLPQQGWPAAPQAVQVPADVWLRPLHAMPLPVQGVALRQQGWPSPPQVPHWVVPDDPSMQPSEPVHAGAPPSAERAPVAQQGCPAPPQVSQVPPVN